MYGGDDFVQGLVSNLVQGVENLNESLHREKACVDGNSCNGLLQQRV